jgi:hypothetical protein
MSFAARVGVCDGRWLYIPLKSGNLTFSFVMFKINRYSIIYHRVPESPSRDVWNSKESGVKWLLINCNCSE